MQTVTTKYLPATNTRGSRIKVSSWLGNKTFSYDYSASCAHEAAFNEWLKEQNERIAFECHSNNEKAKSGEWFKLVAKGSLPDGRGYGFIVK